MPTYPEMYGIGLPFGSPELCLRLNRDINGYLADPAGWDASFQKNLGSAQTPSGHKPSKANDGNCR
jgi:hypothetical protein